MLKDINTLTKKLQQVERNCVNKIKLLQHENPKQGGNTIKGPSGTATSRDNKNSDSSDAVIKQLKARVLNLEKAHDLSK